MGTLTAPKLMKCYQNSNDLLEDDGKVNSNGVRFLVMGKPHGNK